MTELSSMLNSVHVGDALDCLKELPDGSVDLTITSPPYNKRNRTYGWLVNKEKYSHFDDHMQEEEYQAWQLEIVIELFRVTKPGGSLFYNHKLRWDDGVMFHPVSWLTRSSWCIRQEIVWDRGLAANMRGWRFWQVDERIYWLYKPINNHRVGKEIASKHGKFSSIWRVKPTPRTKNHPAPFPIDIPTRIIYSMPHDDNNQITVLDPFSGTGTTLVAAKLLGHNYIGIDLSPEYVQLSKTRLLNAENELEAIKSETSKHVIEDTFAARKRRGTITWPYGPKVFDETEK